ncbi:AbrB family transcriptional regulator [Marinomonas sp. KJ51-3]|uniref:AbrB family transcriptional regulator n=1 Tax=Marinomonas rhodophyticola TaxID=2992803 RepID=A0ABT3KJS6_9GAMM|nr:AbrB family transcriptional regulator [Marinomonas sp. KJ51-3]MCW4630807.1 AbrB family transcriptional regulator [Marinomonas sp. KJ51-3]
MRLVAFMQYLRVACCAIAATVVASVFHVDNLAIEPVDWLGVSSWPAFGTTLAIILAACMAGVILRLPSGPMLIALTVGLVIKFTGIMPIVLPNWCLAISFAVLGWSIGFRFTRQALQHAWHVFPHVLGAIIALIAINACLAMLLITFADIDPLTAFLATSPVRGRLCCHYCRLHQCGCFFCYGHASSAFFIGTHCWSYARPLAFKP